MLPRLFTPALLLVLLLSAAAHADTVVITGGVAQFVRTSFASGTMSIDVTGDGFRLDGLGFLQRTPIGCGLCSPGAEVRFNESFTGTNTMVLGAPMFIGLTVGGVPYRGPEFHTFASVEVRTGLTPVIVPPGNPESFTIVVPFTATGSYRIDSNTTFQTVGTGTINGRGLVEVLIRRDGNTAFYVNQSATYRFQNPAETPEPATLTLFGLGGAGVWLLRRRRAGC